MHMEFALGVLKWCPDTFWASTMCELMAASDGHTRMSQPAEPDAMTREEFLELKEKFG